MVKKILVPVGGSELSWKAFRHALSVFSDADIVVMHVIDPQETHYGEGELLYDDDEYEQLREDSRALLAKASRLAEEEFGRTVETVTAVNRAPENAILSYLEDADVDQVVMGSHGRSNVLDLILGTTSKAVVRRASVPVTVVR
jgi:nucleotide-binding universal stress UspA family protein